MPSIRTAIGQFLVDRELAGQPRSSVATYASRLKSALSDDSVLAFDSERCRLILGGQLRAVSTTTACLTATILSAFGQFCVEQGWLRENPMKGVPRPKPRKLAHRYLSEDALRLIWAQKMRGDLRCTVAILMLGLRVGEVCNLTWDDIDWQQQTIFVRTLKRGPVRTVPFDVVTSDLLKAQQLRVKGHPYIIPGSPHAVRDRMRRLCLKVGVKFTPHTFRHSFASHWLLKGGDPLTLQTLGGWSGLTMVNRYTASVRESVAVEKARAMGLTAKLLEGP